MAQNTNIAVAANTWTVLTNSDVTSVTFQNIGADYIMIKGTTDGTTTPTTLDGSIRYNPGQGERNADLADLFPGVSSADRIWCWSPVATRVFVSHA